jgi:hypothetical protein
MDPGKSITRKVNFIEQLTRDKLLFNSRLRDAEERLEAIRELVMTSTSFDVAAEILEIIKGHERSKA